MGKRKCKHTPTVIVDDVLGKSYEVGVCYDCRARFSLGPSNDAPAEVYFEIMAAEVGQNPDVWRRFMDLDPDIDRDLERIGMVPTLSLGALSPNAQHAYLDPPPGWSGIDTYNYWAGWLAREMATHDEREARAAEAAEYERQRAAEPDCRDEDDDPDDIPIRAGAPEAIGLTPRQLRAQTAAGVAAEDEIREELRPNPRVNIGVRVPIIDDNLGDAVDAAVSAIKKAGIL